MPTSPRLPDGAELYQLYVVEGHTMAFIAGKFGVSVPSVHKALRRHGIRARRRGPAPRGDRA